MERAPVRLVFIAGFHFGDFLSGDFHNPIRIGGYDVTFHGLVASVFLDLANEFSAGCCHVAMSGDCTDYFSGFITYFSILKGTQCFAIVIHYSSIGLQAWM